MSTDHKKSHYKNWKSELDSCYIYQTLSDIEKKNRKGELFQKLSVESKNQASVWKKLSENESNDWHYIPGIKLKIIASLLRFIGPRFLIDLLPALKIRGISIYRMGDNHHEESTLNDEKLHSKIKSGSNLRAAIFGISDGLVSNASLVFAMIGARSGNKTIVLTGISGLIAGGFSMAVGEYISVKSQTELYENQIELEKEELEEFPEEEAKELSLIYQAKGLDETTANQISFTLVKDKKKALDTLAREELGLNPDELGNATHAAISSFISFSIGALIPILPFMFLSSPKTAIISFIFSFISLFTIGLVISLLTGKSAILSAFRITFLGLLAGTTTYFIGHFLGSAN